MACKTADPYGLVRCCIQGNRGCPCRDQSTANHAEGLCGLARPVRSIHMDQPGAVGAVIGQSGRPQGISWAYGLYNGRSLWISPVLHSGPQGLHFVEINLQQSNAERLWPPQYRCTWISPVFRTGPLLRYSKMQISHPCRFPKVRKIKSG